MQNYLLKFVYPIHPQILHIYITLFRKTYKCTKRLHCILRQEKRLTKYIYSHVYIRNMAYILKIVYR